MLCVKELRKSKGLSRYRLSELTGLRESTLQNIENSHDPNPTFKVLCKIADALDVSLDELRRGERLRALTCICPQCESEITTTFQNAAVQKQLIPMKCRECTCEFLVLDIQKEKGMLEICY